MAEGEKILEAYIQIDGKTANADKAIGDLKNKVKEAAPEVESSARKIKESLEGIKGDFGRRSGVGELVETLKGAGAIGGISLALEAINSIASGISKANQELREGKIDQKEWLGEMIKGVPIMGQTFEILDNIHEAVTGEKAARAAVKEIAILTAEADERSAAAVKDRMQQQLGVQQVADNAVTQFKISNDAGNPAKRLVDQNEGEKKNIDYDEVSRIDAYTDKRTASLKEELEGIDKLRAAQISGGRNKKDADADANAAVAAAGVRYHQDIIARAREEGDLAKIRKAAADAHLREEQGTAAEVLKLNEHIRQTQARTLADRAEAHKQDLIDSGKSEPEAEKDKQAFIADAAATNAVNVKEKLQQMAMAFAEANAHTGTDKIENYNAGLDITAKKLGYTSDQVKALKAEFANEVHGQIKLDVQQSQRMADAQLADAGKDPITKNTDALLLSAEKSGQTGLVLDQTKAAIMALDATQRAALTKEDVTRLGREASEVGMSPLDKAKAEAAAKGEDAGAVGDATGKLLGAQLSEEMKTPFQKFADTVGYYKELLGKGDISQRTYNAAYLKEIQGIASQNKKSTIDEAARDRLSQQFSLAGTFGAMTNTAANKIAAPAHAANSRNPPVEANTNALAAVTAGCKSLASAIAKGVMAVYQ